MILSHGGFIDSLRASFGCFLSQLDASLYILQYDWPMLGSGHTITLKSHVLNLTSKLINTSLFNFRLPMFYEIVFIRDWNHLY